MAEMSGLRRYKSIDLVIFCAMLFVFETICYKAGAVWFRSQPWSLSLVPALTSLCYMRWSVWGIFYSALGGIAISFAAKAGFESYVVYIIGNMASAIILLFIHYVGKEKIRKSFGLSALFAIIVALSMEIGRGLVSDIFVRDIKEVINFISTDILSLGFAVLIVLITRKLDGVFEDQVSYLIRINKAPEIDEWGSQ